MAKIRRKNGRFWAKSGISIPKKCHLWHFFGAEVVKMGAMGTAMAVP